VRYLLDIDIPELRLAQMTYNTVIMISIPDPMLVTTLSIVHYI
jgi:hypothetical protein